MTRCARSCATASCLNVGTWFEEARIPLELAPELGRIGVLGMHLEGYGCAGASATAYGLACMELEAGDSGVRSLVSVQGSLAMYAIHRWGSEEQKQTWLPGMAAGEKIGCFGLTEPDAGSDPGSMRTRHGATAATGSSTARRCGSPTARSPTSRSSGRVPTKACAGFLVPRGTPGFTTQDIHKKLSLRASVTSELLLDEVRLPASGAARGELAARAALVPERGALRHRLGCSRRCARLPRGGDRILTRAPPVRPADRLVQIQQQKARDDGPRGQPGDAARAAPRPPEGPRPAPPRARQHGQARERQRALDVARTRARCSARTASRSSIR